MHLLSDIIKQELSFVCTYILQYLGVARVH